MRLGKIERAARVKTDKQPAPVNTSFLSIDQWQDDEPSHHSWLNSPSVGSLGIVLSLTCLFVWGALPKSNSDRAKLGREALEYRADEIAQPFSEASDPANERYDLHSALAGLDADGPSYQSIVYLSDRVNFDPSQRDVVKDKIFQVLVTKPSAFHGNPDVFSIWFESTDFDRFSSLLKNAPQDGSSFELVKAMASLPDSDSALLSELGKHPPMHEASLAIEQEFRNRGFDSLDISRKLINELSSTVDPQTFERIVLILHSMSGQTKDIPDVKRRIADSMAKGGQNLTTEQLERMDPNLANAIVTFAQSPESDALLDKLAATTRGRPVVEMYRSRQQNETTKSQPKERPSTSATKTEVSPQRSKPAKVTNGDFDKGLDGWTTSGAVRVYPRSSNKRLNFNFANKAPDGVASQVVQTDPKQKYKLTFEVFANGKNRIGEVQITASLFDGTKLLGYQIVSVSGKTGRQTGSIDFTAASKKTEIRFRDTSSETAGVDLNLDNIQIGIAN